MVSNLYFHRKSVVFAPCFYRKSVFLISLGITYLPIYYIMCIELKEISAWCLASQRRNIVTIHLTLENSKGEVCDEGEAIYFTFGPDKAKEMGFDSCKVEGEE